MAGELRLKTHDVDWRAVRGQIVVLAGGDREMVLNQAGSLLWPMLAVGCDRERLQARLVQEFGIDEARAERDLEAFLASLRERDLLEG
jgi:Coenzyme PQQ synthesis protein D (PqqD)